MEIRFARPEDADEIVRLAGVMFESMGVLPSDPMWEADGKQSVQARLSEDLAAFVVDHPGEPARLAGLAAGTINDRLPGPFVPSGRVGYVQWVCTEPNFRGQGLGHLLMEALIGWFEGRGVTTIELHSTPMAEALYRSMGFDDSGPRALRRTARPTP